MLMQSYLPGRNEDSRSFAPEVGKQGCLIARISAAESWHMDSKSDTNRAVATTDGLLQADGQCSLNHYQGGHSQLSGAGITSENSAPGLVYKRRKFLKGPALVPWIPVLGKRSPDVKQFVYERRKHQRSNGTSFSTIVSPPTSVNGACTSAIRSQVMPTAAVEKTRGSHDTEIAKVSSMSAVVSNNLLPPTSEAVDGCLVDDRGSDVKDKVNRTIELHSADDCCSSSMFDTDLGSVHMEIERDDTNQCTSSGLLGADLMGDNLSLSTKDLCISILKTHGLLSAPDPDRSDASEDNIPSCSGSTCSRSCNVCGFSGNVEDMLICDECEEAFHIFCCSPSMRKVPVDDWYCLSCFKMKHKMIKEKAVRMSLIIRSEEGSATSEGDVSSIALMLKDSEPYTTGVRVGKGFQAVVLEWSGPITEDPDAVPKPLELDLSHSVNLPGLVSGDRPRSNFIGNWLQCRDIIVGMGEGIDGTLCGKWRRAPLFAVQNDNWDCFCSVLWDPAHADCAVPQELETEEVLKQLKYVEMLKSKLTAKRRKLELYNNADDSTIGTDDASNCTDSTNQCGKDL